MIIKTKTYNLKEYNDIQTITLFFNERNNNYNMLKKYLEKDITDDEFYNMITNTYNIIFIKDDLRNINNKKVHITPHKLKFINENLSDIKHINIDLYESLLKIFKKTFHKGRITKDLIKIKKEYKSEITYLRNKAIKSKEIAEKELTKSKKIIDKCNFQVRKIK